MRLYFKVLIFFSVIVAQVFLLPFLRAQNQSSQRYSFAEAQKVLKAIDKVKAETEQAWSGSSREIVITESELNSYIAYRIEAEKEEIMKELRLNLFEKNRIEGKIHVTLRGQEIPQFIRQDMDFYFAADLEVADGKAKLDLKELFLGDEPIQPLLLDLIIAISAKISKVEASSISDWYELPYGIKDIKTQKSLAIFYY
jgi:hypothetical protein